MAPNGVKRSCKGMERNTKLAWR